MSSEGSRTETSKGRKAVFVAMAALGSTSVSVLLLEIALRVLNLGFGSSPLESDEVLHHVHPTSYQFTAYSPIREFEPHLVRYDEEGFVVKPAQPSSDDPARPNLVLLGDSFVEAGTVAWEDSMSALLAQRFNGRLDVLNFGVTSYSPLLSRLQLERFARPHAPDFVVHLIYANDPENDANYQAVATLTDTGDVIGVSGAATSAWVKLARQSYAVRLFRFLEILIRETARADSEDAKRSIEVAMARDAPLGDVSRREITHIDRLVRQRGGSYALACVPSKLEFLKGENHDLEVCRTTRALAEELRIPFLDLRAWFLSHQGDAPFYANDIHFTARGHQLTAECFAPWVEAALFERSVHSTQ